MGSFFTDAEKVGLEASFKDVFYTFARPLTVYQEAQKTIISSDPNWSPYTAYNQNNTSIQNTPVSTVISGTIMWDKKQEWDFLQFGGRRMAEPQLKVKDQTSQAVRVKVDYSGYSLLATAKKVQIDGVMLDRTTEPRPHGLFGTGMWTFFYVRSN